MIRLTLLLLGARPLRQYWWAFAVLALVCAAAGESFLTHRFPLAIITTTDILGALLILEGVVRLLGLAAIGFPKATIPTLKALGFMLLGLLAIDVPWDDNIVATIVLGTALILDGLFRWAAAAVIRSVRWRHAVVTGFIELIVAAVILTPWPVPYRRSVPFFIGIALFAAAWNLIRLSLQLRRLKPGASVTELPLFAGPNWHARGMLPPAQEKTVSWANEAPLTVHVWTPVGSAVNPQRRFLIDRYIAAVDKNGVISTGHAAMSMPPDTYVSLCAANDIDQSREEFTSLLRADEGNNVPGAFRPSLEEECAGWRRPDREVRFFRYNKEAVLAFLAGYKAKPVYNLTSRNCSSSVALSLDAAVEGALGTQRPWRQVLRLLTDPAMWLLSLWRARAEAMTWTPGLVLDYAQTLQHVLEGRHETWLTRLKETRANFLSQRRAQVAEGHSTRSTLPALISLVATALIFGLTYGLSAPLIALSLAEQGYGEGFIGLNATAYAAGVLLVAPFLPRIAWRVGPKLAITAALLGAAIILALFPVMPSIWLWFPLRLLLGVASETMFVISETWLNQLSGENRRAQMIALYTAGLSLGFALGPMILSVVENDGVLPFLIAAVLALVALLSIAMPWVRSPVFEKPSHGNPLRYLALAPVALAATLVNAAVETAGMSLLPLYAMHVGWSEQGATLLLSVLLLGAIILQLPIGWLADRVNRRGLVIVLGLAATLGALAWPQVITSAPLAYALLFVWGGLFVGIYTVMMAAVGSRFKGGDLVSIYAVISIAWGAGAFVGPSAAGAAMNLSPHGLPYFAASISGAFTLLALLRRRGT